MTIETVLENSLVARAEFIVSPDDLLSHAWGVLVVCDTRPVLERIVQQMPADFCILQTDADIRLQGEQLLQEETCSREDFQKRLTSYQAVRQRDQAEEEKLRICRKNKELAKSALKSAKAQNAWLNRENAEGDVRRLSMEREIADLEKAQKQNERKIEHLQQLCGQYESLLPGYTESERHCTQEADADEEQIRQMQAQLTFSDRLFHAEHVNEIRRHCARLSVRVDNKRMEASHAAASYRDTVQKLADVRRQLNACRTAKANMQASMANSRRRYTRQEKGLSAGKGMVDAQDERLKNLTRRIAELSALQEKLEQACMALRQHRIRQARSLVQAYIHLERFRQSLKRALEKEEKTTALQMILFAAEGVICSGSNAGRFWEQYDMHAGQRIDI